MSAARWLAVSDMSTGADWIDLRDVEELAREYRRLTDWSGPEGPIGLWVVLARLAFTRNGTMPPGGVLLGIGCDGSPPPASTDRVQARVSVEERTTRSGKRLVTVQCALRNAASSMSDSRCSVTFRLFWPEPPADLEQSALRSGLVS